MDSTASDVMWKVTNPFGQEVQLKRSTYNTHILNDNNRIELENDEIIKSTIEKPRIIRLDKDFQDTRSIYFDIQHIEALHDVYFVKVVVDYTCVPQDVVTALICRKLAKSETGSVIYDSKQTSTI